MTAQASALALQRAVHRRAMADGLFRDPPRTARMALQESLYADVLRGFRQLTPAPREARTRLGDKS